jgi:phospholipase C
VISPWAKANYVDHAVTDQTSILRLIEDVVLEGERLGQGSFDARSGSLNGMFNFNRSEPQNLRKVLLDSDTGLVLSNDMMRPYDILTGEVLHTSSKELTTNGG